MRFQVNLSQKRAHYEKALYRRTNQKYLDYIRIELKQLEQTNSREFAFHPPVGALDFCMILLLDLGVEIKRTSMLVKLEYMSVHLL
tara:strand:+ start:8512 stop:8769 length:258 start_codon:yes stop_codon:yes gene_type:complete